MPGEGHPPKGSGVLTALPPRARRAGDTICDELIDEAGRDAEEGEGGEVHCGGRRGRGGGDEDRTVEVRECARARAQRPQCTA